MSYLRVPSGNFEWHMTLQPLDLFDTLGDPWLPLSLALVGVGESGDPNGEWIFSEMVGLWSVLC